MATLRHTIVMACLYILAFAITMPLAAETVPVFPLNEDSLKGASLVPNIEYLRDDTESLRFADILNNKGLQFIRARRDYINFGFISVPFWFRFTVNNPLPGDREWFLEINYNQLDNIELYVPGDNGAYQMRRAGDTIPYDEREFDSQGFVFKLNEKPGTRTYYFCIRSESSMMFKVSAFSHDVLLRRLNTQLALDAFLYGIMAIMFFYNLLVFFASRDASYGFYTLLVGLTMFLFSILDGMSFRFFFPNTPWITTLPAALIPLINIVSFIFSMVYLRVPKDMMPLRSLIYLLIGMNVVLGGMGLIMNYGTAIKNSTMIQMADVVVLLGICLYFLIKRHRPAYFLVPGWFIFLIGVGLYTLLVRGLLPQNMITMMIHKTGAVVQLVIFSFGLADKLSTLKNELKETNVNLERMVNDRTRDLEVARDALWGEIQLAKHVQTVLLPEGARINGYRVAAVMHPAEEVGGDYFDIINLEGHDWIFIGDVSGHGISAGIVMMMVQTSIQTMVRQFPGGSPARVLGAVNQAIRTNLRRIKDNKFMTIAAFKFNDDEVEHAGFHENVSVYRKAHEIVEVHETLGIWLGIEFESPYRDLVSRFSVAEGDVILLYTDGVIEASYDQSDNQYGLKRLCDTLRDLGRLAPADIIEGIMTSLGPYSVNDDVTLIVLKSSKKPVAG